MDEFEIKLDKTPPMPLKDFSVNFKLNAKIKSILENNDYDVNKIEMTFKDNEDYDKAKSAFTLIKYWARGGK